MAKRKIRYMIRVTENVGGKRRVLGKFFKTKSDAKKHIKKILSPAKKRKVIINGKKKTITLTSYRNAQYGTGLKNPRIIKRKIFT